MNIIDVLKNKIKKLVVKIKIFNLETDIINIYTEMRRSSCSIFIMPNQLIKLQELRRRIKILNRMLEVLKNQTSTYNERNLK